MQKFFKNKLKYKQNVVEQLEKAENEKKLWQISGRKGQMKEK